MKRWLYILIPLAVLGSMVFWRIGQKKAEVQAQSQQRAARVSGPAIAKIAPVELSDISHTFEATGSVEAPLSVKIAPKITGRIEYLTVREGDRVKRGQVLVRIDSSDVEAQVQSSMAAVAEAKYRLAQAQLNQTPTDVAVVTQIRQQKAAVASAEADLNQATESARADVQAAAANVTDAESKVENAAAAVKSAQANLENAKAKYERINSLYKQGFTAAQDVDDAKAAVTVQQSAVEVAQGQVKSAKAQNNAAEQHLAIAKAQSKANVEAAKAKLTQARASLENAQANTVQKPAYRQSLAALQAGVEAAQATLRSAQSKRRDTVLVSPLDGYVTGRYSDPGAIASPTQPILGVQFINQVWVTVNVPEEVCAKLHMGQEATLRFDAYPKRTFTASIVQINPSGDPDSRQFTVRVIMSNKGGMFKPGMFAHVNLETERIPKLITVPREAVQRDRDGQYVMAVGKDHKAKRTSVVTGPEDVQRISVVGEVNPGDQVVVLSSMPVRDGQTVVSGGGKGGPGGPGKGAPRK